MKEYYKYHPLRLNPLNITILYLLLGFIWIAFSDRILEQNVDDTELLTRIQTYKGWLYVAITGILLYGLISRYKNILIQVRSSFNRTFNQYKALLEHGNQIIIQVDERGFFQYVNPVLLSDLGYQSDEIRSMEDLITLIHEKDRERFQMLKDAVLDPPGEPFKCQLRICHKNGTWRWFMAIAADGRSVGNIESALLFLRDVHDENLIYEELKEVNSRYEHIFQEAPVGYHNLDRRMTVTDINKTGLDILGYQRDEVTGSMSWYDFLDSQGKKEFEQHKKTLLESGRVQNKPATIVRKDGSTRNVILSEKAFFGEEGQLNYTIGNILDLTEKVRAEQELEKAYEELRSLNDSLEKKVQERTRELEESNNELEAFAYSVSHDLRAPLRVIDGFSQALLDQYNDKLDEKGVTYLNRVCRATHKMGSLIDDLLSLSRISRAPLASFENVDLDNIISKKFESLKQKEPEVKARLLIHDRMKVKGDPRLLAIIVDNLVQNAWKFSSKRDEIVIEAGMDWKDGQKVSYIRDNGAGFNMKYYDKLFDVFQRLHPEKEFTGTGVGLATVKRIVDRHNGRIWAESAEDQGCVFYMILPEVEDDENQKD